MTISIIGRDDVRDGPCDTPTSGHVRWITCVGHRGSPIRVSRVPACVYVPYVDFPRRGRTGR